MAKWIKFQQLPQNPKKVTKEWEIKTEAGDLLLGTIRWLPSWRRYAFFPEKATVYEHECLKDISEFLLTETNKQKEERKK